MPGPSLRSPPPPTPLHATECSITGYIRIVGAFSFHLDIFNLSDETGFVKEEQLVLTLDATVCGASSHVDRHDCLQRTSAMYSQTFWNVT